MDTYSYLKRQILRSRDAYDATLARRRKLYHWLKANESWRSTGIREKLGNRNHDWLIGLVIYGDARDWGRFKHE